MLVPQVAVLVLDAVDCTVDGRFLVTQQDFRLSELIGAEGRAAVIVVNKWDAVPQKDTHTLAAYQKEILAQLRPLDWATVVFTSALSGGTLAHVHTKPFSLLDAEVFLKQITGHHKHPRIQRQASWPGILMIALYEELAEVDPPPFKSHQKNLLQARESTKYLGLWQQQGKSMLAGSALPPSIW